MPFTPGRLCALAVTLALFASLADADAARRKSSRRGEVPYRSTMLLEARTGQVLKSHKPHLPAEPASLVKMMTTLLVMERVKRGIVSLDDIVTVSRRAARMGGQQVYLAQGEEFSLRDLMKSVVISSANDSSYAVAEHVSGNIEVFVELMNERAQELGMTNTTFVNVNGLPTRRREPGNRMSAHDAAILARELLKYPRVTEWSSTKSAPFRDGTFVLTNTNTLLKRFRGMDGLKTGYHRKAGFSVVATAKRKGLRLIAVVMGSSRSSRRFREASRLLAWGFARYHWVDLKANLKPEHRRIDVLRGEKRTVRIRPGKSVQAFLKHGEEERTTVKVELPEEIPAPVRAGQQVGRLWYELDGKKLGEVDLVAAESTEKLGFFRSLLRW